MKILYLIFALLAALVCTAFLVWIGLEFSAPGVQYISDNQFYNSIVTAQSIVLIFFVSVCVLLVISFRGLKISSNYAIIISSLTVSLTMLLINFPSKFLISYFGNQLGYPYLIMIFCILSIVPSIFLRQALQNRKLELNIKMVAVPFFIILFIGIVLKSGYVTFRVTKSIVYLLSLLPWEEIFPSREMLTLGGESISKLNLFPHKKGLILYMDTGDKGGQGEPAGSQNRKRQRPISLDALAGPSTPFKKILPLEKNPSSSEQLKTPISVEELETRQKKFEELKLLGEAVHIMKQTKLKYLNLVFTEGQDPLKQVVLKTIKDNPRWTMASQLEKGEDIKNNARLKHYLEDVLKRNADLENRISKSWASMDEFKLFNAAQLKERKEILLKMLKQLKKEPYNAKVNDIFKDKNDLDIFDDLRMEPKSKALHRFSLSEIINTNPVHKVIQEKIEEIDSKLKEIEKK